MYMWVLLYNIMFNYKIYVAPEVYHKKSDWSYYYPEKTLSY